VNKGEFMQQYSFYYLLKETKQKALENEARAALLYTLHGLKVAQPSVRQRLARMLVEAARHLDPLAYPSPPLGTVIQREPKC
jgi:hypothetical protein